MDNRVETEAGPRGGREAEGSAERGKPLRALLVEDDPYGAELTALYLREKGYDLTYERVESAGEMTVALRKPWDVVLSDFSPRFGAREALEVLKDHGLDIPVIIISGTVAAERAVPAMRAGARDFVLKDELERLFPAIERELSEAALRRRHVGLKERDEILLREKAARVEAELASRRLSLLAEATRLLILSLEPDAILRRLSKIIVPELADWFAVDLADPDGRLERVAVSHVNRERVGILEELRDRYPPLKDGVGTVETVFRTGQSVLLSEITDEYLRRRAQDEGHFRILKDLELKSAMVVPLVAREKRLGVISLVSEKRRYTEMDLSLAEELARRAAIAMEHAKLYDEAQKMILQLRHQKEELERSNRELAQFAYVASHDLQEPLRMVVTYIQFLDRRLGSTLTAETRQYMDFAVSGALRMKQLVEDLLAYSRVGSGETNFGPTDFNSALEQAKENLRASLEETGTEIEAGRLPTLPADRTQIVQLFQNLIGNSIKYRSEERKPRIRISAEETEEAWKFCVSDNGIGFSPKFAERIFVIFQRLHADREKYPGTGIGLAICKKIVERHRGRIWAESELGQGATFRFTLPRSV